MPGQIREGDIGSLIRVGITEDGQPFDVSQATAKILKLQRPNGTVIQCPTSFETDGTDGICVYLTAAGDITQPGPWSGQMYLVLPNGSWHSEFFNFQVGDAL